MTPGWIELEKAKESSKFRRSKNLKSIKDLPDTKKELVRQCWRERSKKYRDRKKYARQQDNVEAQINFNPHPH